LGFCVGVLLGFCGGVLLGFCCLETMILALEGTSIGHILQRHQIEYLILGHRITARHSNSIFRILGTWSLNDLQSLEYVGDRNFKLQRGWTSARL